MFCNDCPNPPITITHQFPKQNSRAPRSKQLLQPLCPPPYQPHPQTPWLVVTPSQLSAACMLAMPHSKLSADCQGPATGPMLFGTNVQHTTLVHAPREAVPVDETKTRCRHRNTPQHAQLVQSTHTTYILIRLHTHTVTMQEHHSPPMVPGKKSSACRLPKPPPLPPKTCTMQHQQKQALRLQPPTGSCLMPYMQLPGFLLHIIPGRYQQTVPEHTYNTDLPTPYVPSQLTPHSFLLLLSVLCMPPTKTPRSSMHALLARQVPAAVILLFLLLMYRCPDTNT
jgi:hypothetical protein